MTRSPPLIRALWAAAFVSLMSCANSDGFGTQDAASVPEFASAQIPPPPGTNPDGCWVRDVSPAKIETQTRQIEVAPAQIAEDGTVLIPARFQTEIVQEIVRERQELIFETPCPEVMTPTFIETLQRALDARGLYRGTITGVMDVPTRLAVRRYQSANGLASGLLSIQTARRLGLLATPREDL